MGAAVAGLAFQAYSSLKSSGSAKKEARKAQQLERLMTSEELRRLEIEQHRVLGGAKAQIAASGFTGYGASTESYLQELQKEQGLQSQFTAQVGASKASAIGQRGKALSSAYKLDAMSSFFQGSQKFGESFDWGLDNKGKT